MTATSIADWYEANQRHLVAALTAVRATLQRHAARTQDAPEPEGRGEPPQAPQEAGLPAPPALETLSETFGLSPFEREVLLMCAGMELDSTFAALCANAQGDPQRAYPTFGLAMAALPDVHWSATTPAAPLRYWRLVEVGTGDTLATSPLRIDERVLHYLAGVAHLDERLQGLVEPLQAPGDLLSSHRAVVHRIVGHWSRTEGASPGPVIHLCGDEDAGKQAVAAAACATLGLQLHAVHAADIPAG
ncbi:MAG: ATP-binding protein, partial [Chloroflexota bacterium]|nr:ATP-binding protein [Chloroflexota bacterium]